MVRWEAFVDDDSGETYYYDHDSGESTWDKPPGFGAPPPPVPKVPAKPKGAGGGGKKKKKKAVVQEPEPEPEPSSSSDDDDNDAGNGGGAVKRQSSVRQRANSIRARPKGTGGPRWWEKVEEDVCPWQELTTAEGSVYYVNTETQETQYDKPVELMSEEELALSGEWVWVPHEEEVYVPAKVLNPGNKGKSYKVAMEDGVEKSVSKKQCFEFSRASLARVVSDLTLLDDMSAQLILHNLRERFKRGHIYTNIGSILISINPYDSSLPLYTDDVVRRYKNRGLGEVMPPHIYNIAHEAYYGITAFDQNQSIIISGESGAGKTWATKQALKFLAAIAGSVNNIEKRILQANPILEAFGNARTIRNDNSSRFGKYLEIPFNSDNEIAGSNTRHYLLEKVRVVQQSKGERNFHIFYQVLRGLPRSKRKDLDLDCGPEDFAYTSTCTDVPNMDDKEEFDIVEKAFDDLGFTSKETSGLYSLIAAILHCGNVEFSAKGEGSQVSKKSKAALNSAAKLIGVDPAALEECFCTLTLRITGQSNTKRLRNPEDAAHARNALAKFVYSKMFDFLVMRVNESMGAPKGGYDGMTYIGCLDIFGFEIFKHNSFEQLCINFTNEMLQQHFNKETFKKEQKLYEDEGITVAKIEYIDNQPIIDLISKKTRKFTGLLTILHDELAIPGGSDQGFFDKMKKNFKGKIKAFGTPKDRPECFRITHYAGKVFYDHRGFLEKNNDNLAEDVVQLLCSTSNPMLQVLYPKSATESTGSATARTSLGKQFNDQLKSLMKTLNKTQPHYVRCIKPNEAKAKQVFEPRNCFEQLTYSGVFEAVAIRKQGFPFRLSHKEFAERYALIAGMDAGSAAPLKICKGIIDSMKFPAENIQIGKTKVLYRAAEYRKLELDWSIKMKHKTINDNLETMSKVDTSGMSKAEKEKFFMKLAKNVREADIFKLDSPAAEKSRQMLERYMEERMDPATKKRLKKAYKAMDKHELQDVLDYCEQEGFVTDMTRKCTELLNQICDADEALEFAVSKGSEEFLTKALEMCDAFGYNQPNVQAARRLLTRIVRVKEEAAVAVQYGIEDQIRAVVTAAKEVHTVNPDIAMLQTWLQMDREEFLGILYAKAKASDDADHANRAVRIAIELKDIFVAKRKRSLDINAYENLKDPTAWAKEAGIFAFNKKKIMEGMLVFQKNSLHAPMTTNVGGGATGRELKAINKAARDNFEVLKKFMGQAKTVRMPQRLDECFLSCAQHKGLRDELFIAIYKQTVGNLNPAAVARAWEFLAIVLAHFGPSLAFADRLEAFVRTAPPRFNLPGLLARRLYHGDVAWKPLQDAIGKDPKMYEKRMYTSGAHEKLLEDIASTLGSFQTPVYDSSNSTWQDLKTAL